MKHHASYRPANAFDADTLSRDLRDEDVAEIAAGSGKDPHRVLHEGLLLSDPCYAIIGSSGSPVGMCGVVPTEENTGAIWLLCSPRLVDDAIPFLRQAPAVVEELNQRYPVLFNLTDARNTAHHRWLAYCGFIFINRHERVGPKGLPFYEFVRIPNV